MSGSPGSPQLLCDIANWRFLPPPSPGSMNLLGQLADLREALTFLSKGVIEGAGDSPLQRRMGASAAGDRGVVTG